MSKQGSCFIRTLSKSTFLSPNLKVLLQFNYFARLFKNSFHEKLNLSSIHYDWLVCASMLFNFDEIIGQTIKLFSTGSDMKSSMFQSSLL